MDDRTYQMLKSKIYGGVQEVILPDFPNDDNTVTTTVTKSRRVSFGTNFVKEFIVDAAVSAQCVSEYEQAFLSSDSSNANSSYSAVESDVLEQSNYPNENHKGHHSIPPPPEQDETRPKIPKFASTICFSADSPTADMEFTEGCLTLAKSILDKKNKEMTVIIQAKSKEDSKIGKEEETKYFDGSQFDMSMRGSKSKEHKKEERRFDGEKTKVFSRYDDEMSITRCDKLFKRRQSKLPVDDESDAEDNFKENQIPLDLIMRHLDKDNSDLEKDLFNPEKPFTVLNSNPFDLSNESEKLNLNESMDISRDFQPNFFKAPPPPSKLKMDEEMETDKLPIFSNSDDFDKRVLSCDEEVISRKDSVTAENVLAETDSFLETLPVSVAGEKEVVDDEIFGKEDEMMDDQVGHSLKVINQEEEMDVEETEEVQPSLHERETEETLPHPVPLREIEEQKEIIKEIEVSLRDGDIAPSPSQHKEINEVEEQKEIDVSLQEERMEDVVRSASQQNETNGVEEQNEIIKEIEVSLQEERVEDIALSVPPKDEVQEQKEITQEIEVSLREDVALPVPQENEISQIQEQKEISKEIEVSPKKLEDIIPLPDSERKEINEVEEQKDITKELDVSKEEEKMEDIVILHAPQQEEIKEAEEQKDITKEFSVSVQEEKMEDIVTLHAPQQEEMNEVEEQKETPLQEEQIEDVETFPAPLQEEMNEIEEQKEITKEIEVSLWEEEDEDVVTFSPSHHKELIEEQVSLQEERMEDIALPAPLQKETIDEPQEDIEEMETEREPPLIDTKVIENLKEQSKEPGCRWSLKDITYTRTEGLLSFTCHLLESSTTINFFLKMPKEDSLDACSLISKGEIVLNEEQQLRLPEYKLVIDFGFQKTKKYFEEGCKRVETIRHVSYFLDQLNSFVFKINSHLNQIYSILTLYPGSRLNGSTLTFRLFSFPVFFSCTVSVDLTDLFRLSESCLSFEMDFGSFDSNKIREIFQQCTKCEDCLCQFIIRSTRYLIDLEYQSGYVSKRKHIQLLPVELRM